jgi:hypothetical protein
VRAGRGRPPAGTRQSDESCEGGRNARDSQRGHFVQPPELLDEAPPLPPGVPEPFNPPELLDEAPPLPPGVPEPFNPPPLVDPPFVEPELLDPAPESVPPPPLSPHVL